MFRSPLSKVLCRRSDEQGDGEGVEGTVELTSLPLDQGDLLGVELVFLRQLQPRSKLRRRALEASDRVLSS